MAKGQDKGKDKGKEKTKPKLTTKEKQDKKRVAAKTTGAAHGQNELFDALKDLRNRLAKEKNLPSYIVFNDKSLHDMCALRPRNASEFLMVHGVGQNKLENYGTVFIDTINKFL